MRLAKVIGNVVSTIKDDGYYGYKLMLVEYLDPETQETEGRRMIAFDCADAGVGDIVLVNTDGGAGNLLLKDDYAIVDLTICGVVDSYSINGKTSYFAGAPVAAAAGKPVKPVEAAKPVEEARPSGRGIITGLIKTVPTEGADQSEGEQDV